MDIVLIAIVGMLVGGAVNALADELPVGRFPRPPRNEDGSRRPVYAWLGVTALLFEVWQAKPPQSKLSWRYPLTELTLAGLMAITQFVTGDDASLPSGQRLIWQAYAVIFVLLAVVDLERRQILIKPVLFAAALAVVDAAVFPQSPPNLASALVGGLCGGATFSLIYLGGRLFDGLVKRVATPVFGLGDVYLMGLAGLILGFPNILVAIVLAIALAGAGAAVYLALTRLRKRRYKRFTALPYAPYILMATTLVLLFQGEISHVVFGLQM